MKKSHLPHLFAFFSLILLLSSCASYQGTGIVGSANLSSNNFRYVATGVQGDITITRFLGLGGLGRQAMVAEAKKELMDRTKLKDGQALANIAVDLKISYLFIITLARCTVTADVVEFSR